MNCIVFSTKREWVRNRVIAVLGLMAYCVIFTTLKGRDRPPLRWIKKITENVNMRSVSMELSFSDDLKCFVVLKKVLEFGMWMTKKNLLVCVWSWFVKWLNQKLIHGTWTYTCYGHWKCLWSVIGNTIVIFVNLKDLVVSWQCDLECKKKPFPNNYLVPHLQIKTTHVDFHCHWTPFQGTQGFLEGTTMSESKVPVHAMVQQRYMAFPHACSNRILTISERGRGFF